MGGATTDPPARPSVLWTTAFMCLWSAHSPQGPHLITGPFIIVMILFQTRRGLFGLNSPSSLFSLSLNPPKSASTLTFYPLGSGQGTVFLVSHSCLLCPQPSLSHLFWHTLPQTPALEVPPSLSSNVLQLGPAYNILHRGEGGWERHRLLLLVLGRFWFLGYVSVHGLLTYILSQVVTIT